MPAKTIDDLPNDAVIELRTSPNNTDLSIEIIGVDGKPIWIEGEDQFLFALTAERLKNPDDGREVWRVLNTLACQGWGPFVYDLAMEMASSGGRGGLLTGTGQSDDAKGLWTFYRDNRPDVAKTPLPDNHPWMKQGHVDPGFPFYWSKPLDILPKLTEAGILQVKHGTIEAEYENGTNEAIDDQLKKLLEADDQDHS